MTSHIFPLPRLFVVFVRPPKLQSNHPKTSLEMWAWDISHLAQISWPPCYRSSSSSTVLSCCPRNYQRLPQLRAGGLLQHIIRGGIGRWQGDRLALRRPPQRCRLTLHRLFGSGHPSTRYQRTDGRVHTTVGLSFCSSSRKLIFQLSKTPNHRRVSFISSSGNFQCVPEDHPKISFQLIPKGNQRFFL